MKLKIAPDVSQYLMIQHGKVSDHRSSFAKWQEAYEASLEEILENIKPVLPHPCRVILDIGSGLGGIDILLSRYYASLPPHIVPDISLVDGEDDPPEVISHTKTFSSRKATTKFMFDNNMLVADNAVEYVTPTQFHQAPNTGTKGRLDLVVSFAAYGFHIHPGDYILTLLEHIHDKTVLIFDVRRSKREWLQMFIEVLGEPKVLFKAEKYVRVAFRAG